MAAQADEIVALMKSLVPKRTGDLEKSIGWTFGDKAPKGSISLGRISGRGARSGGITITIFAGNEDAYYARWVEFGTQAHSLSRNASVARGLRQGQGRQHKGTSAQPFFYVSWRAGRKQARNRIRKAARDAAKIVAKS